jgi:VanZ family protein
MSPERIRRLALVVRTLAVVVLVGIFLGTHLPTTGVPTISHLDKLFHFGAYLTLTVCLLASWELSRGTLQASHYFMVWLFGTLYGIFDEVTQIPVGRTCDGYDWLADVAGIVVGLILFRVASSLVSRVLRWNRTPALSGTG